MKARFRCILWVVLAASVIWWQIRSHKIGDALGGPSGGSSMVELVSWKGRASVNVSWPGAVDTPWRYWTITMGQEWVEYMDSIEKIGIHRFSVPAKAWIICWPIPIPLILAFLTIEIPPLVRYFRRKRKRKVNAASDEGKADDPE